jgi:ubiquinone/menaquinone biosynthesis C-methylase UbiE
MSEAMASGGTVAELSNEPVSARPSSALPEDLLRLLRSPDDRSALEQQGGELVACSTGRRFRIAEPGIPLFAEELSSPASRAQQEHYDRIAAKYVENLGYPHTQAYTSYLDDALLDAIDAERLGTVAEICCGSGEAFKLLRGRIGIGIGVDVSLNMLRSGTRQAASANIHFVQGDATRLPLASGAFDTVFMLGGIHHVNDRRALFSELHRILRPGGRFCFREPLDDFVVWRGLRAIIYRVSPTLDHLTERPLRRQDTVPLLESLGFDTKLWKPLGFLGFCLFMNSDVLVFNRLFRFVPGIGAVVKASCRFDDLGLRTPGLRNAGLQVVGVADKPA